MDRTKAFANKLVSFLNRSPSPFHATTECSLLLENAGFSQLCESRKWSLKPGGKYFFTRNDSTVIAFTIGGEWKPGNGFSMIAAHTDSPCFKIKPNSKITAGEFLQLGVMCYGGALWRTWFDRDLSIAGKVIVKNEDGMICQKLVNIDRPIMSIPNLAIHLDRTSNDSFTINKETHLVPILGTKDFDVENKSAKSGTDDGDSKEDFVSQCCGLHHAALIKVIAKEAAVNESQLLDFEMCVYDTQPACIGGLFEEFIYGARLDNLVGSFAAIHGLIESLDTVQSDPNVRFVACFDNEEIGSETAQGAQSSLTEWVLRRICASGAGPVSPTAFEEAIAKSYLISADQAHAVHPNYEAKHEKQHQPKLHKGVAVKINANQRYATSSYTHAILKLIAAEANVPLQSFVVRNDSACGSTVGPVMAAKLGLSTVDVGTPQLAMHSAREMCCTSGVAQAVDLYAKFFEAYPGIFERVKVGTE